MASDGGSSGRHDSHQVADSDLIYSTSALLAAELGVLGQWARGNTAAVGEVGEMIKTARYSANSRSCAALRLDAGGKVVLIEQAGLRPSPLARSPQQPDQQQAGATGDALESRLLAEIAASEMYVVDAVGYASDLAIYTRNRGGVAEWHQQVFRAPAAAPPEAAPVKLAEGGSANAAPNVSGAAAHSPVAGASALASWTCPHCQSVQLSVMPHVAERWAATGCLDCLACEVAPGPAAAGAPRGGHTAQPDALGPADTIVIEGLANAVEHNGRHGLIHEFDDGKGRYVVSLLDGPNVGRLIRLKPENVAPSAEVFQCTRCLQTWSGRVSGVPEPHFRQDPDPVHQFPGKCRVPHPVHRRQVRMSRSTVGGGMVSECSCEACGGSYQLRGDEATSFCFDGVHTTAPIPRQDERRVDPNACHLVAGPQLQAQIERLPETMPDVRTLTINSSSGGYNEELGATLCVRLPNLRELQLNDVAFDKITLTPETTPDLQMLKMQNVPNESDPGLRTGLASTLWR
jgi:hypothetical protein